MRKAVRARSFRRVKRPKKTATRTGRNSTSAAAKATPPRSGNPASPICQKEGDEKPFPQRPHPLGNFIGCRAASEYFLGGPIKYHLIVGSTRRCGH